MASVRDRITAEPKGRIAAASAAIVILLAGSIGLTLWRYETAISAYQNARDARTSLLRVEKAGEAFFREQAAIYSYSTQPSPSDLRGLRAARGDFTLELAGRRPKTGLERGL